jgi:tetratricopeptide (TPR) repeat protein
METRARRIGAVCAIVLLAGIGGLLGGVLRGEGESSRPPAAAATPVEAVDTALAGFSLGDSESLVARLQETLRENPDDVRSLTLLGLAYQQRARETGDPVFYTKSEGVLREALILAPDDLLATSGLGSLALARHDFEQALELGERARDLSPTTSRNYGVIGDALVELGRYDEAFAAFDRMAELKPGLASYARVSYGRELLGDVDGAVEAMELAVDAARGSAEPAAWSMTQLGKIHFSVGSYDEAARWFDRALLALPGYVFALDAMAHVEAAKGNLAQAIQLELQAAETNPLPQFVATLGDLYEASGRRAEAGEQRELMDAIQSLLSENGVRTDLETAVYYADHDIRAEEALAVAEQAHRERPSVQADDALAWALYRNGRCEEALAASKRALRLGTVDAALYFHRGMIERCLGNGSGAERWLTRALETNPGFSVLLAPVARAILEEDEA